jgi:Natural resistance-associated macrophage protein
VSPVRQAAFETASDGGAALAEGDGRALTEGDGLALTDGDGRALTDGDARTRALSEAGPSPLERLLAKGRLRATLTMLGPAFVASIAYVDPGNFATNLQGGAQFGYLLMWVVLLANLMAMLVQYLSAKLAPSPGQCGSRPRSWPCRPTSPSSWARRSGSICSSASRCFPPGCSPA